MRCPSCNKFPSFDIGEPELDLDVENGIVTGTARLFLTTQCCGDEAKETNFEVEINLETEFEDVLRAAGIETPDLSMDGVGFELTSEDGSGDERWEDKTKKGKPIKPRYQKKFYTLDVNVDVLCTYPRPDSAEPLSITITGNFKDEVQASGMDEL